MENFELCFHMASPIAFGYRKPFTPLMFDGLLTWLMKGNAPREDNLPDVPLPLEQSGKEYPYYHASAWELENPKFGMSFFVKRRPDDWAKRKLDTPSKKLKQMLELIPYIATPKVTFWGRGSINDVRKIIDSAKGSIYLGSKRVAGWGKVKKIEGPIPLPDDYSVWDKHGRPARPIPVAEVPPGKVRGGIVLMPYKPPYWTGEKIPCLVPPLERWWPGISEGSIAELENKLNKLERAG